MTRSELADLCPGDVVLYDPASPHQQATLAVVEYQTRDDGGIALRVPREGRLGGYTVQTYAGRVLRRATPDELLTWG